MFIFNDLSIFANETFGETFKRVKKDPSDCLGLILYEC